MIEKEDKSEASAETPLPNSRKIYIAGQLHPEISVPFREISLAPTKTMSGENGEWRMENGEENGQLTLSSILYPLSSLARI